MVLIGPGLGNDIDDAARVLPILSSVVAALNAELLERIGKREGCIYIGVLIDVIAAVEQEVCLIGARAVDGDENRDRGKSWYCPGRPMRYSELQGRLGSRS